MFVFKYISPEGKIYQAMRKMVLLPWLVIFVAMVQLTVWVLDREPPFKLISYSSIPVRAGGILSIDGYVQRDISRSCSVYASRHIMDSHGTRHDIGGIMFMNADEVVRMDNASPGEVHQKFQMPLYIAPGRATFTTSLVYICNPLHELFKPIPTSMVTEFEVLP
jgi:hypothetical protein